MRSWSAPAPAVLAGALVTFLAHPAAWRLEVRYPQAGFAVHAGAVNASAPPAPSEVPAAADERAERAVDLPRSSLDVRLDGRWVRWWSSTEAPVRWRRGHRAVAAATRWERLARGVELSELRLRGSGEAWRLRVILLRLDPRELTVHQAMATRQAGTLGAWTIDSAPETAVVAFNGGHFSGGDPWGWVVRGGREIQPPGTGSLAAALVIDTSGRARIVPPDSIQAVRVRAGISEALQSYPILLRDGGVVPPELRTRNELIDLTHRDARLAVGELRDGRLIIALTRFDALDGRMSSLPFGPTVPEIAALMGALGCRSAVLLDGGISAQLAVRDSDGARREWKGMRMVPLGILVTRREPGSRR